MKRIYVYCLCVLSLLLAVLSNSASASPAYTHVCRLHAEAPFASIELDFNSTMKDAVDICDALMPGYIRKDHLEFGGTESTGPGFDPNTHNPRDCIVVDPLD